MPVSLLSKISKAARAFEDLEDELEDFFLSQDPEFMNKMRSARQSHLAKKTRPLKDLKKTLCMK